MNINQGCFGLHHLTRARQRDAPPPPSPQWHSVLLAPDSGRFYQAPNGISRRWVLLQRVSTSSYERHSERAGVSRNWCVQASALWLSWNMYSFMIVISCYVRICVYILSAFYVFLCIWYTDSSKPYLVFHSSTWCQIMFTVRMEVSYLSCGGPGSVPGQSIPLTRPVSTLSQLQFSVGDLP
jgi:hypothetical protein